MALAIPEAFFREAQDKTFSPLLPIGNLLEALPQDIEVIILVEAGVLSAAENWIRMLSLECSVHFRQASLNSSVASPWLQDAFHVRSEHGSPLEILAYETKGSGFDIAAAMGGVMQDVSFHLHGGNQIVGPNFRIVGHSDFDKIDAINSIDARPVSCFGYRLSDLYPPRASFPSAPSDSSTRSTRMHQYGFHVDQFVSVTGLRQDGRPLLLLAAPVLTNGATSTIVDTASRSLNASSVLLQEQGFEIRRNPVPYVVTSDTRKCLPRLYNNVILENAVRPGRTRPLVWLPAFSQDDAHEDFNLLNTLVWEGLGFEVRAVAGWEQLTSRNGALRCSCKVLERKPFADKS